MAKACNGNYRTDYFQGCGTTSDRFSRTYGLCPKCLYRWSKETEKGKEWYQKRLIKTQNQFNKEERKKTKEAKVKLLSKQSYWSKILQPKINEIARLIDKGQPCIATGNNYGQMHGGHYFSVGSNLSLSLNLHNIHIQSAHSNKWKSGDDKRYKEGLTRVYGIDYFDFIDGFKKHPLLNISLDELYEVKDKTKAIIKELKSNNKVISNPVGRILERNRINLLLGVYSDEYAVF